MKPEESPTDDDRRDPDASIQQHVAQVWADSIARLDVDGLFRLGTACLEVAEGTADPRRGDLVSSVAFSLLAYAGGEDPVIGARIAHLCEREQQAAGHRAGTARVIADLGEKFAGGLPSPG
jgi:hypothetical protein